ncbi:unnamed protein product [Cylindrotheca closterium]|uniref:RING-type domain-containing protein n=1 Tax=Cylindrotheca closterium TaxID=2856 RepID=A0AAD2FY50_9STRA|nr:unnamed protein product [Cylindrotheca closterium]
MLDFLFLGLAIALWACYCCRRRRGIQGLRRVPILTPKPFMSEEDRLALIEKQLVTVKIGGTFGSVCNLVTAARSMYEANCCNCAAGASSSNKKNKDCKNKNDPQKPNETSASSFDPHASQRSVLSRTWSAASVAAAQQRQDECIICFEEYQEGHEICWAKTDQCQHVFHKTCALEWLKRDDNCPLCRVDIINAKTVTYEEVDADEVLLDATELELHEAESNDDDLELGEAPTTTETEGNDTESEGDDNAGQDEESNTTDLPSTSIALSEGPQVSEDSPPLVEHHDLEAGEQDSVEVVVLPPAPSHQEEIIPASADDETEESSFNRFSKAVPSRSVDFAGSIHTDGE